MGKSYIYNKIQDGPVFFDYENLYDKNGQGLVFWRRMQSLRFFVMREVRNG